jgi:hypothetical protein
MEEKAKALLASALPLLIDLSASLLSRSFGAARGQGDGKSPI